MGRLMPKAFHSVLEREVWARHFEDEMRDHMLCSTKSCIEKDVRVSHIQRETGEDPITVRHDYKLWPGHAHSNECPFETKNALRIISSQSPQDLIAVDGNSVCKIWLTSIMKVIRPRRKTVPGGHPDGGCFRERENKINYVRSLRQIIKLRSEHQDSLEMRRNSNLEFLQKKLTWDKFYITEDRYIAAYQQASTGGVKIPMVIEGTVKSLFESGDVVFIQLHQQKLSNGNRVSPSLMVDKESDLLVQCREFPRVAVIGFWYADEKPYGNIKYLNLKLRHPEASQLVLLEN